MQSYPEITLRGDLQRRDWHFEYTPPDKSHADGRLVLPAAERMKRSQRCGGFRAYAYVSVLGSLSGLRPALRGYKRPWDPEAVGLCTSLACQAWRFPAPFYCSGGYQRHDGQCRLAAPCGAGLLFAPGPCVNVKIR